MSMDTAQTIEEVIRYTRRFRGSAFLVSVGAAVLAATEKLGHIVKDLGLLRDAGIRVVVVHSDGSFRKEPWLALDPVSFLDLAAEASIAELMTPAVTPVVRLRDEKATVRLALELRVAKIVYVTNQDGVFRSGKTLVHDMDVEHAREMMDTPTVTRDMRERIEAAIAACQGGISRVHIIGSREGGLLREVLTCEGSGTMIYDRTYGEIRGARKTDVLEVFKVVRESIRGLPLTIEYVEKEIDSFLVYSVDGQVRGCMRIRSHPESNALEVSHLGASLSYENPSTYRSLVERALDRARQDGAGLVYLDPERNTNLVGMYPWFKELGFRKDRLGSDKAWISATSPG
jgi:N-acetylglutamate synthase-like GNAT family acetyltransferase